LRGKGGYKSYGITSPNLEGVEVIFKRKNAMDKWNAENHAPKQDKSFYIKRYYENKFGAKQ